MFDVSKRDIMCNNAFIRHLKSTLKVSSGSSGIMYVKAFVRGDKDNWKEKINIIEHCLFLIMKAMKRM